MAVSPKLRILLIDDEMQIRALLSEMLAEQGHRVTTAACAREALQALLGGAFDIVFIDQYLGKTLGMDLMQELGKIDEGLYFIMMTGYGSTDLAVEALQLGASDFLVKPFFEDDVVRSIDSVLKERDLDREGGRCPGRGKFGSSSRRPTASVSRSS